MTQSCKLNKTAVTNVPQSKKLASITVTPAVHLCWHQTPKEAVDVTTSAALAC